MSKLHTETPSVVPVRRPLSNVTFTTGLDLASKVGALELPIRTDQAVTVTNGDASVTCLVHIVFLYEEA